ncbi:MAG: hypothetical protein WBZ45_04570, partial [Acidimicrobiia bacterium]
MTTSALAGRLRANRTRVAAVGVILFLFLSAFAGLDSGDWFVTIMQGLSVGAITFLVASGLSLIFGLMDVLNLAHGELFMLGAYVGWTAYTRFDTLLDVTIPALLLLAPFALTWLWRGAAAAIPEPRRRRTGLGLVVVGLVGALISVTQFPLVIWDLDNFAQTPTNFAVQMDTGLLVPLPAEPYGWPPVLAFLAVLASGALVALGLHVLIGRRADTGGTRRGSSIRFGLPVAAAIVIAVTKGSLNQWAFGLSTTWRFFVAMAVAVAVGAALGAFIEVVLIRPLYDRPIYQLMLTLGVGFIIIELVREVWGQPQFTMARPAAFAGTGAGCPGQGVGGFFSGCSTVEMFGSRLRVYN